MSRKVLEPEPRYLDIMWSELRWRSRMDYVEGVLPDSRKKNPPPFGSLLIGLGLAFALGFLLSFFIFYFLL